MDHSDVWEPEVLSQTGDHSWITVAAPFEMARDSRELIGQPVRVKGTVHRIVGMRNDAEPRDQPIRQGESIRLWLRPDSEDEA